MRKRARISTLVQRLGWLLLLAHTNNMRAGWMKGDSEGIGAYSN